MESVAVEDDAGVSDVNNDLIGEQKREWKSVPIEIKQKIIKYLPIIERFRTNSVNKEWQTITAYLNTNETKLVFTSDKDYTEVDEDVNSVCNLASHTFDRTCILLVPRKLGLVESRRILNHFPSLVAIHVTPGNVIFARTGVKKSVDLEHFSCHDKSPVYLEGESPKISCLDGYFLGSVTKCPNLKYYTEDDEEESTLESLLKNGLRGHAMKTFMIGAPANKVSQYINLINEHGQNTEILYNVDFQEMQTPAFVEFMTRLPKLTTIYGRGTTKDLLLLANVKQLTKLAWNGRHDEIWSEADLRDTLMSFGHRLRSLRIGVRMNLEKAVRAVVETCPNLEHLSIHQYLYTIVDNEEKVAPVRAELVIARNSFEEFKLLKQLTSLKTCEIEWRDVDVKFLRMLDVESVELKEMCKSGEPMSIKQMIYVQHKTSALQALAKKVVELESQVAKRT